MKDKMQNIREKIYLSSVVQDLRDHVKDHKLVERKKNWLAEIKEFFEMRLEHLVKEHIISDIQHMAFLNIFYVELPIVVPDRDDDAPFEEKIDKKDKETDPGKQ